MVESYTEIKERYPDYLNDESGIVKKGFAERLYFPKSIQELVDVVNYSTVTKKSLTISGGGTGLSGGRVPYDGWIIATDKMNTIQSPNAEFWKDPETNKEYEVTLNIVSEDLAYLTVPPSIPLKSIQNYARQNNWFYPPDPTERTSFIGGNVSTNASGARSFKYGTTRDWIQAITVVLADSTVLHLSRDDKNSTITSTEVQYTTPKGIIKVPRPTYPIPKVRKHVVGPILSEDSDPLDLFIGTNGIFGIITEITLKLIRPPQYFTSIFLYFTDIQQAMLIIDICQKQRKDQNFPVPMSVEMLDKRSIDIMRQKDDRIPEKAEALIMLEQDALNSDELQKSLTYWNDVFEQTGILGTSVAQNHKEIKYHKFLRHCVPEYIISLSKQYGQSLIVTDTSTPSDVFEEFYDYLTSVGLEFEEFQKQNEPLKEHYGYYLFGHVGDCHPHLSLVPRNEEEYRFGYLLLEKVLNRTVEMGGSIASEHGLGKKKFGGKPALHLQYGMDGFNQVMAMKMVLDPDFRLCPGNLIEEMS